MVRMMTVFRAWAKEVAWAASITAAMLYVTQSIPLFH
jgi:hypothetical protein